MREKTWFVLCLLVASVGYSQQLVQVEPPPYGRAVITYESFEAAKIRSNGCGEPFLVFLGFEGCFPCKVLKEQMHGGKEIPSSFGCCSFVEIDIEKEPAIASEVRNGFQERYPLVVLMRPIPTGWRRTYFQNYTSASQLKADVLRQLR